MEAAFHRFSQLCKDIGIDMATAKREVWSAGHPTGADDLAQRLGILFAMEGIVAAGCPIGSSDFAQFEANYAAGWCSESSVCLLYRYLRRISF